MTEQQRTTWNLHQHPLTIVADRYGGVYSGGKYTAFPLDFDEIPAAVHGDDVACSGFWWGENTGDDAIPYGLGESPEVAFQNLKEKMGREDDD